MNYKSLIIILSCAIRNSLLWNGNLKQLITEFNFFDSKYGLRRCYGAHFVRTCITTVIFLVCLSACISFCCQEQNIKRA